MAKAHRTTFVFAGGSGRWTGEGKRGSGREIERARFSLGASGVQCRGVLVREREGGFWRSPVWYLVAGLRCCSKKHEQPSQPRHRAEIATPAEGGGQAQGEAR